MNYNLRVPAAERKNVATGASPWMEQCRSPSPVGRKIPRIHSNLSPLWGWDPGLLFTPGLRPGLHSVAAPRLKPQRAHFIHTFWRPGLHSVAAPRLRPQRAHFIHTFWRPGLHSVAAPRLRPQRETNSRSGSVTPTPDVSRPLLVSRPGPDSPPGGGGFPRRLPAELYPRS